MGPCWNMAHSSDRYVARRLAGNKSRMAPGWYVQGPGSKVLQGPFKHESEAVASIAGTLQVKPAALLRSSVQGPAAPQEDVVFKYMYVAKA